MFIIWEKKLKIEAMCGRGSILGKQEEVGSRSEMVDFKQEVLLFSGIEGWEDVSII